MMKELFTATALCLCAMMLIAGCEGFDNFGLGKKETKTEATSSTGTTKSPGTSGGASKYQMPFPVKIGGQQAKPTHDICGSIANPVAANAEIIAEVDLKSNEQVIINAFESSADGKTVGNQAAAVIVFEKGKNKSSLDKDMQGKKLKAGTYMVNVVAKGKTARVMFKVK
jgi:hypothetical protein